jgi:recombination protein RecR
MALYLLKCKEEEVEAFGNSVIKMRREIIYCSRCGNISDQDFCEICRSPRRDGSIVCVVEDIRDVMAIEHTGQYNGVYHVLGGIISPLDGVGPGDLNIDSLILRSASGEVNEIILALPSTIEGDTTNFFLFKKLNGSIAKISMIARGISIGDELEHTDEVTLGRSIINRTPYESTLKRT